MEGGATRLFETRRLCATLEAEEKKAEAEAAKKNPMAALEKRTKDSQREMLLLENLAELTEERRAKMKLTSDIMLRDIEKSAEEKQKLDDQVLGKLAQEVLYQNKRLTEEDAKREEKERKRKYVMIISVFSKHHSKPMLSGSKKSQRKNSVSKRKRPSTIKREY